MMGRLLNPTSPLPAALLAALALVAGWSLTTWAQDPFGAPAAKTDTKRVDTAADLPAAPEPLALQQLRESNPTTPTQLMHAAEAAYRFGRPDETKRYLGLLIESRPTSEAIAPLTRDFADLLLRLAREPQVQPEGKQVADAVFGAAEKVARDPARIVALVPQLASRDDGIRSAAVRSLREAGPYAVGPLLTVLADPNRAAEHRAVRDALTLLEPVADGPLLGALQSPDESVRAQVMVVLGRRRVDEAAWYLVQPALDPSGPKLLRDAASAALFGVTGASPTQHDAERLLQRALDPLLAGRPHRLPDPDGTITLWRWDVATNGPQPHKLPTEDACRMLADRLTSELLALAPTNIAYLKLRLLAGLEWSKVEVGLTQPLPRGEGTMYEMAVRVGPEMVSDVLQDALNQNRTAAALGAIEVLADTADVTMLAPSARESALARATAHGDLRVRTVAALTIAAKQPTEGFPLASRMRDALTQAAQTRGLRKVLVGHPRLAEATDLVGRLALVGFEGEVHLTGQALLKAAVADVDCEMILITDAIDRAPVLETVQALRKDYRTARIPIGVLARAENADRLELMTRDIPLVAVAPHISTHLPGARPTRLDDAQPLPGDEPVVAETAVTTTDATDPAEEDVVDTLPRTLLRLEAMHGRNLTTPEERLAYAALALDQLTALASIPGNVDRFNLLQAQEAGTAALSIPALTQRAAKFLRKLGTPQSQTALVEVASAAAVPIADRQIAAQGFAAAVRRRGLMLTTQQIVQQYDRYNASEQLDAETQQVFGALLDTIESARK